MSAVSSSAPRRGGGGSVAAPAAPPAAPRRRRLLPLAVLGLLVLAAAAYVQQLAWATATFANDELIGVIASRRLEADLLGFLLDPYFDRGPERLTPLLQVPAVALFSDAIDALRAAHVILAVAFFSTAAPVYALARGVGLDRWPAVLVAAMAIVTPWAVFGATLLTVTVGVPAMTLFAWATWRAAVRPSVLGDVLVLAAAAVNILARTGHAPLTVVALVAVVYAVWLRRPTGEAVGRSLLRLPLRVVRTHPLLVGVFVLGAVLAAAAVAVLGIGAVVGPAYESASRFELPLKSLWDHSRDWFVQLTMATGYLPVLVGGPWLVAQLVRPTTPERGVFAVVALSLLATFVLLTSAHQSVSEERYLAVFAGLPAVAFGAAVFSRQARPLGTLVVGLLAAAATASLAPFVFPNPGYVPYQIGPARLFFEQVAQGRVDKLVPGLDDRTLWLTLLLIVAAAFAAALATAPAAARRVGALRGRQGLVAVAVSVPVLLLGAGGAAWALGQYRDGLPADTMESVGWVDPATDGEEVFIWSHFSPETREARIYLGLLTQHFNRSASGTLWLNDAQDLLGPDGDLPGDETRFLVRFAGYVPLGFESRVVARRDWGAEDMRLERFVGPARAALKVEGAGPDGAVPVRGARAIRVAATGEGESALRLGELAVAPC